MIGVNFQGMLVEKSEKVLLETSMGNIVIELYDDMPITSGNFKKLVEQGFYGAYIHQL